MRVTHATCSRHAYLSGLTTKHGHWAIATVTGDNCKCIDRNISVFVLASSQRSSFREALRLMASENQICTNRTRFIIFVDCHSNSSNTMQCVLTRASINAITRCSRQCTAECTALLPLLVSEQQPYFAELSSHRIWPNWLACEQNRAYPSLCLVTTQPV